MCVTGGGGFLGSVVVGKLRQRGADEVFVPRKKDYDLVHLDAIKQLLADSKPDIIIRRRVCAGLENLGIKLDATKNSG